MVIYLVPSAATRPSFTLRCPNSQKDLTPQIQWSSASYSSSPTKQNALRPPNKGALFEVADINTGALYTVNDVVAELIQPVSLPRRHLRKTQKSHINFESYAVDTKQKAYRTRIILCLV